MNSISSTLCKEPKDAELNTVNWFRRKLVTDVKESAWNESNEVALVMVNEPWMASTLANAALLRLEPEIVKFPTNVEHEE